MSLTDEAADENDLNLFKEVSENNYQRIHEKISKVGYADGINDGRESTFQSGFDQGYVDGLRTGHELQKFRTFFEVFNNVKNKPKNLELLKEKSIYEDMQIPETKNREHFQYSKSPDKSMDSIAKQQHKYVDEFLEKCDQTLPITSNLLAAQKKP